MTHAKTNRVGDRGQPDCARVRRTGCAGDDTVVVAADASTDVRVIRDVTTDDGPVRAPFDSGPCGNPPCFDPSSTLSFTTPPPAPTANQGKCADDDLISQFLSVCIEQDGERFLDAGNAACNAFVVANQECSTCLAGIAAPDAGATPLAAWPAVVSYTAGGGELAPDVAACVAAISSASDDCKKGYASISTCAATICLNNNPSVDDACIAAIAAVPKADADSKCAASTPITTNADFANVFLTVGRTLCENGSGDE